MKKSNKMLLEALQASLQKGKVVWEEKIEQEDWLKLFQQAEMHQILPLIYDAVYSCPAAKQADPAMLDFFKKRVVQQVMLQTMKTGEFLRLYRFLGDAGIHPVIVKGMICRELYPNPDYRASSDEDLLIRPEEFEHCHRKLLEFGMVPSDRNQDIHTAYEVPYGKKGSPVYIELHKHLFPPESEAYGEFNRFFADAYETEVEISAAGIPVFTLEYTDHFFYLICHAFKHFLHSGFGIRQVCDIVLFANTYGSRIDWGKVLEQCREIHAEKFVAALLQIGEKYLVFSPDRACFAEEWKRIRVDETALLEDLLSGGIYGDASLNRKHSSNMTLSAVEAEKRGDRAGHGIRKTLFPPARYMETQFAYVKKFPFLLPIAWLERILKYRKEAVDGANNAAESIRIGTDRVELMREYGIIGNETRRKKRV